MKPSVAQTKIDPVRPGEQWFFYWKTSAALWEGKVLESPQNEVIFIPLFWGFHQEAPGQWDFGAIHPERDLARLTQILMQHRRKFCWILPVTPAPFCPNGGVPVSSALSLSISHDGSHLVCLDQEKKLNKMYSFFEPKVFQQYSSFLKAFAEFLAKKNIKAPCWGASFSYVDQNKKWSYLFDRSHVFEQGFSKYLRKNAPETDLNTESAEEKLKEQFTREFSELFRVTAEGQLSPYWAGNQDILVIGGSPRETIERGLTSGKTQYHFFRDIFDSYVRDQWLSTCLLGDSEKSQLLPPLLKEHFGATEIDQRFNYGKQQSELSEEMKPFGLVDIFCSEICQDYARNGLLPYLEKNYPWMYQLHKELNFTTSWIEGNQSKVKFFHGSELDRVRFGQMIKLFMMGQQVILDRTGLHPDLDKKLQIFYLENNLALQTVNYLTTVTICGIGEGKFITFEGEKLFEQTEKEKFWQNIFKFLSLSQPVTTMDEEVFGLWRIRAASATDLNYLDVRRVDLYNPTSYRKHVAIHTKRHFAFMKMIDPVRAEAKSTPEGVEIELLPFGRIALDFGHYEEL